jgi:ABC-type Fe3+-hydroxamate transport system substrate-binding protein
MMKYILIVLLAFGILSGCKNSQQSPAVNPASDSTPSRTILFTSGQKEIQLVPDKKVVLGWIDMIGDGVGGGTRATAELSGDTITVVTGSDMSGTYKESTNTIALGDLPKDFSGGWGIGRIHVKGTK